MSRRDRRALVAGLGVVLFAWLPTRGIPGARSWLDQTRSATEQRAALVTRARQRIAGLEHIADSITALEEAVDELRSLLLVGGDPETAAVDLMVRSRHTVASTPGSLVGFGTPTHADTTPLAGLTVPVRVEADLPGLLAAVRAFESDPALRLTGVEIVATDPHATPDVMERLTASLFIQGWYRPAVDSSRTPLVGS